MGKFVIEDDLSDVTGLMPKGSALAEGSEESKKKNSAEVSEFQRILFEEHEKENLRVINISNSAFSRLDELTKVLPKGRRSSKGLIVSNLINSFCDKYKDEIDTLIRSNNILC